MTSRWLKPKKIISILISLVLVLILAVSFGQVMGSYYLENISKDPGELGPRPPVSRENTGRTRVLRLNKYTYYTILLSEQNDRDAVLNLGQSLAQKGLPVIITGNPPYRVLLGFINNGEKLSSLAESIRIDEKKGTVIRSEINSISYKFSSHDTFAEKNIAPYIGRLSTALEKSLALYSGIRTEEENIKNNKARFAALAGELEKLAAEGEQLSKEIKDSGLASRISSLSASLRKWAQSLRHLESGWSDTSLLISQQQALVFLQEYEEFLKETN